MATLIRIENREGEECDDQGKEAAIHDFNRRTEERTEEQKGVTQSEHRPQKKQSAGIEARLRGIACFYATSELKVYKLVHTQILNFGSKLVRVQRRITD